MTTYNFKEICAKADVELRKDYEEKAKLIVKHLLAHIKEVVPATITTFEELSGILVNHLNASEMDAAIAEAKGSGTEVIGHVNFNGELLENHQTETNKTYSLLNGKLVHYNQPINCELMHVTPLMTQLWNENMKDVVGHNLAQSNAIIHELNEYGYNISLLDEPNYSDEEIATIYAGIENEDWASKESCMFQAQYSMEISAEKAEAYC